jgi:hypothetical protein
VLGSLTLGGYDENRFEPNDITFSFGPNAERPTSLVLQHITADSTRNGTVTLLRNKVYVNLDYTTPYLWLPADTCDRIASQFNLSYDASKSLYLVGDNSHAELVASNPSRESVLWSRTPLLTSKLRGLSTTAQLSTFLLDRQMNLSTHWVEPSCRRPTSLLTTNGRISLYTRLRSLQRASKSSLQLSPRM